LLTSALLCSTVSATSASCLATLFIVGCLRGIATPSTRLRRVRLAITTRIAAAAAAVPSVAAAAPFATVPARLAMPCVTRACGCCRLLALDAPALELDDLLRLDAFLLELPPRVGAGRPPRLDAGRLDADLRLRAAAEALPPAFLGFAELGTDPPEIRAGDGPVSSYARHRRSQLGEPTDRSPGPIEDP
jgi:hypothetical protein